MFGQFFRCLHHHQADVGAADRPQGAGDAEVLHGLSDTGLAPQPRRVNQQVILVAPVKFNVDGVAGGSGHVGDNGALLVEQSVDKGGFTHVRPADNGHLDDVIGAFTHPFPVAVVRGVLFPFTRRRKVPRYLPHQRVDAEVVP
ncbi:MAG: hypothetical protein BWX80_03409 [Candidatus Hydrogenedentes bacterium ADurb.Bin101]|nr:MAG: hypothetical protein BWX80_03409 [Candidatus Hydrogenedentes bacterium ADurb.Bin101]